MSAFLGSLAFVVGGFIAGFVVARKFPGLLRGSVSGKVGGGGGPQPK